MSANPAHLGPAAGPQRIDYLERRQSARQPLNAVGVLAADGESQSNGQLQVLILNVSLGGVGFRSPVPYRTGAFYQMKIGTGPLHLKARLQIISSRPREDGMWDVGAKFL